MYINDKYGFCICLSVVVVDFSEISVLLANMGVVGGILLYSSSSLSSSILLDKFELLYTLSYLRHLAKEYPRKNTSPKRTTAQKECKHSICLWMNSLKHSKLAISIQENAS